MFVRLDEIPRLLPVSVLLNTDMDVAPCFRHRPFRIPRCWTNYKVDYAAGVVREGVASSRVTSVDAAGAIIHNHAQDYIFNKHFYNIQNLHQSYLEIHRMLSNGSDISPGYRQVEANMCFIHETLQTALGAVVDLNEDSVLTRINGKGKREVLEELQLLQRDLSKLIHLAAGRKMKRSSWMDHGSSAPKLFVVLPSDLDTWRDTDPATHNFRLYLMCQIKKGKNGRHVHLSSHQGYNINQPEEFFRKYGYYVLTMLTW